VPIGVTPDSPLEAKLLYTKKAPVATTIANTTTIIHLGALFFLLSLLLLVLDVVCFLLAIFPFR
jgi:hypothetical protein